MCFFLFQFELSYGSRYLVFYSHTCRSRSVAYKGNILYLCSVCIFYLANGILNNTASITNVAFYNLDLISRTRLKHIACVCLTVDNKRNNLVFGGIADANIKINLLILRNIAHLFRKVRVQFSIAIIIFIPSVMVTVIVGVSL